MMRRIKLADFRAFIRTKEDEVLHTQARRAKFTVQLTNDGVIYTPLSTMKSRPHDSGRMEKILNEFYRTGSYNTRHYQQITVCASYTLALIGQYLAQQATPSAVSSNEDVSR